MMFIIADKQPTKAVNFLIENTNKNYCFKQLLELSQLLASCGYTKQMKPIRQGADIQGWIKQNKAWTYNYYKELNKWVQNNINLKQETRVKFNTIEHDIQTYSNTDIKDVVFRYKQGYVCKYKTNSLLPINIGVREYKKYITEFKFCNKHVMNNK